MSDNDKNLRRIAYSSASCAILLFVLALRSLAPEVSGWVYAPGLLGALLLLLVGLR